MDRFTALLYSAPLASPPGASTLGYVRVCAHSTNGAQIADRRATGVVQPAGAAAAKLLGVGAVTV